MAAGLRRYINSRLTEPDTATQHSDSSMISGVRPTWTSTGVGHRAASSRAIVRLVLVERGDQEPGVRLGGVDEPGRPQHLRDVPRHLLVPRAGQDADDPARLPRSAVEELSSRTWAASSSKYGWPM